MNKTVDISERTLEKEKKNFIVFCKVAEALLGIALAFTIIGAIVIFTLLIVSNVIKDGAFSEAFRGAYYTMPENIFNGIFVILACIGMSISLNFGVKVFKTLKDGETPFRYEIADKIKAAGMALIGTGFLAIVAAVMEGFFKETTIRIELDFFIWGAVILAIAYIFNYGCKLQQESDETI